MLTLLYRREQYLIISREKLRRLAAKLIAFGLIIYLLVPCSIVLSTAIENTYQDSIDETIQNARENTEAVEKSASDQEDQSAWDKLVSKFEGGVSGLVKQFEKTLSSMLEAIAVLIVTSCLIPILVLVMLVWIAKMIFAPDWSLREMISK